MAAASIAERIHQLDWTAIATRLDADGYAVTAPLLRAGECRELIGLFDEDQHFRSTVNMRRVRFGSGIYRYFDNPLPETVTALREHCYAPLAGIANDWATRLRLDENYPTRLETFLHTCHANGQTKPTPLLFHYTVDDHNALHQDIYGDCAFPFQIVTVLSAPDAYSGGEFVLYTQRPRAQSLAEVVNPERGRLLIFPNQLKPVLGRQKGRYYRSYIKHGVSRIRSGERYSLGIIFHDAA